MRKKQYTLEDSIKFHLKDPKFRKAWKESEAKYQLTRQLIKKRLDRKLSQRALAKKAKTTQAVISRIESMSANPSFNLLQRLATALGSNLKIAFE
ncbi:helix-turn-helix transcriptional regulator [Candidatus Amesbacteria bacterium]|nr:helix-turn-helix transcriptional regulator [Candidatus Amesbacteria bacterium]